MDFNKICDYTEALSKNNNRTWFHDNHKEYEEAREDFIALCDIMKFVIAQEAPKIGDSLIFENTKNFLYRIPRDMRYSMGKEPYNPAFRAYFSPKKKDFLPLSYFLYVNHESISLATGAWPWEAKDLTRLREYIMYNYEELESIVCENELEIDGKALKRVPRGYDAEHPAAEWMKHKYYVTEYVFTPEECESFESFTEACAKVIRRFEPFRLYLMGAFQLDADDDEEF